MKKILIINTVGYNYDGITSVILNYLNNMDRSGLSFVFPIFPDTPRALTESLSRLGAVETVPHRKHDTKGYCIALHRLLKNHFDVIHIHGNSGTMLIETVLAKVHKVLNIIVHAHNSRTEHPFLNMVLKWPMMRIANKTIACSDLAGKWLYGKHEYIILNNAVDSREFCFCQEMRQKHRTELGVGSEFLIGHVGHFSEQKNHIFLVDVFKELRSLIPDAKLLLISDGPLFHEIQKKTIQLGLTDAVIFAGRRTDVAYLYSAMDFLVLPSRWEGLPLTMVEAQINGLAMLVSDVITRDAAFTTEVYYKSLDDGPKSWAAEIFRIYNCKQQRISAVEQAINAGFDISEEAEILRSIYFS